MHVLLLCHLKCYQSVESSDKMWSTGEKNGKPLLHSCLENPMNTMHACMLSRFSCVQLCATLWAAACQAPLSTGFSRQEYWSGLPFPSPLRSMNQGKLEVVQQEMAGVNINILRISELKWTRMGEFNSCDYYIYCCG